MSGVSKRLHEDGGHSTPIKRSHEESSVFSSLSGKTIQPLTNDFHLPYEPGLEGRPVKVQRIETRDSDKRPLHRISSSPNHVMDHPTNFENRPELRASKEARDGRTVVRELKSDTRDSCIDIKIDLQGSKIENDTRDIRSDEKDLKSDRGSYNEFKGVVKFDRDSYAASISHITRKESKDHLWPRRYTEPANESMESWGIARHLQNTIEIGKDQPARAEDRTPLGSYEGIVENKMDLKGKDKFREKEKRKKDDRQKDFGDWDKDRSDRRGSTQLGEINNDDKELKEDRELERWERERIDILTEQNDPEKDHVKRESSNSNERENSNYVKEVHEGSIKISDQAVSSYDPRRPKDDGWKGSVRDLRDKKRENDADIGDRYGQAGKCYDKDMDDGTEGDAGLERDRDAFVIQQRRRMLRSRGASQLIHREPRFRSRSRDHDGSQGKSDVSAVVYKAGECMQEILRTWREFEASRGGKTTEAPQSYPTIEILIPVEYVASTNRQVRGAQLWGTDVYTNDSDVVAVLMHAGYCCPTSTPPPSAIHELRVTIQVLPPKECYTSTLRNNVRSRSWGAGIGCSFSIERCCIIKKGGGTIDLEPCRTHVSAVEPTIAPVSAERTMTTRAAASNALRQQRFVREVTIQYNLCNEPWLKYSINIVADKGLKKPLYTSARLKKGEVLYLETHYKRYELCFNGEKSICNGTTSTSNHSIESEQEMQESHHIQNVDKHLLERENNIDVYRWSRCKKPLSQDVMHSIGIPSPLNHLEVLEENLDWEDVQWSQTGVWVAGKEYPLARVHFLSPN